MKETIADRARTLAATTGATLDQAMTIASLEAVYLFEMAGRRFTSDA